MTIITQLLHVIIKTPHSSFVKEKRIEQPEDINQMLEADKELQKRQHRERFLRGVGKTALGIVYAACAVLTVWSLVDNMDSSDSVGRYDMSWRVSATATPSATP